MNKCLRWVAVVPVAFVGCFVAGFTAFAFLEIAARFCPADEVVSGSCVAPWYLNVETGLMYFGIAFAGALVVLFPVMVAPSNRQAVAWIALVIGSIAALSITQSIVAESVTPIIAGAVVVLFVHLWRPAHDA